MLLGWEARGATLELSVGLEHVTVSLVSKDMAEVIGGLTALIANSRRPWLICSQKSGTEH